MYPLKNLFPSDEVLSSCLLNMCLTIIFHEEPVKEFRDIKQPRFMNVLPLNHADLGVSILVRIRPKFSGSSISPIFRQETQNKLYRISDRFLV